MNEVYILGGGRTDFKRNLKKEGKTIRHIIIEAGKKAIDDAKIDPAEIQAGAVGNCSSERSFRRSIRNCVEFQRCTPKRPALPGHCRCYSARNGSLAGFMTSY